MSKILSFDPSGNFTEGKGTTGVCYMEDGEPKLLGQIEATRYNSAESYWHAHLASIEKLHPDVIVIEGYRLYNHKGNKAESQANSTLETPQLIGAIRVKAFQYNIPLVIQYAAEAKPRWKESVLVAKGYLTEKNGRYYFDGKQTSTHKRDAMKHALQYYRYGRKK